MRRREIARANCKVEEGVDLMKLGNYVSPRHSDSAELRNIGDIAS
jgi:hypothetical protein